MKQRLLWAIALGIVTSCAYGAEALAAGFPDNQSRWNYAKTMLIPVGAYEEAAKLYWYMAEHSDNLTDVYPPLEELGRINALDKARVQTIYETMFGVKGHSAVELMEVLDLIHSFDLVPHSKKFVPLWLLRIALHKRATPHEREAAIDMLKRIEQTNLAQLIRTLINETSPPEERLAANARIKDFLTIDP